MALVSFGNVTKSFGENILFENVSFGIEEKDKIGLVGVNGCGKTTLFRIITGFEDYDSGEVFVRKDCCISYLEQQISSGSLRSVYDEVLSVFDRLLVLEERLSELEKIENMTEDEAELQSRLHDEYVRGDGLVFKSRTASTLKGLGFSEADFSLSVSKLSGGQITRLMLCKTLLSGADLILLDEPTNHLDIESVQWLEKFLSDYTGAYIVISHDRYFLDHVTDKTIDIAYRRVSKYIGGYSEYLKKREDRELAVQRNYDNTMREVKRIEGIIEQQKQWNRERNIKTAESKQKSIDRLLEGLETPDSPEKNIKFKFNLRRNCGNEVLNAEGISKSFGDKTIFQNAGMNIRKGERAFLLGANGCGKTTFLKILMKQSYGSSGTFSFGAGVEVGYYDQLQSNLAEEKTVFQEIYDEYPEMKESEVRSALAAFLFRGEDVFKIINTLSGGERARVLLCKLMLSGANFLILDEPTNHLDIASCEALEAALSDYEGTLLAVSHDRYFINKLANKIYFLDKSGTTLFDGNYDYYLEKSQMYKSNIEIQPAKKVEKVNDYKLEKERRSLLNRLSGKLSRCEERISELEEAIALCNEKLCDTAVSSDYEKSMEISSEAEKFSEELDEQMELWQKLSEELEAME